MDAESYVGITLWSPHGEAIGLIAVIGRKPLFDTRIVEMVLKQVAIRAAAELDHRNADKELNDSEKRLRSLYESMNDGLAIHEIIYLNGKPVDYIITEINPAYERITGLSRDTTIGKKASELYGNGEPPFLEIYARVASGGPPENFDTHFEPMGKFFSISVISPANGKFATIFNDITERKLKEFTLQKINSALTALGKSSQAMVKAIDEPTYLEQVCNIVVEDCGYSMVWIGYAEDDKRKSVRPVASAGFSKGYIENLNVTWDESDRGKGPTGTAIRTGRLGMCSNMLTDPAFLPWRKQALEQGYASSVVFPLKTGDHTFGALSIYSKEHDGFNSNEIKVLSDLSCDLAQGITSIRLRELIKKAEYDLIRSYEGIKQTVKERTEELQQTNLLLKKEIATRKVTERVLTNSQKQLRALRHRMDMIAEEERTRISREVHDELGHMLTALKYDIDDMCNKPSLSKVELDPVLDTVETLINTVRKISTDLRPGILDHLGLFAAMEWQINQFQKRTKIHCKKDITETDVQFDQNETTIIFRILQEILTNVARHSKAKNVTVSVKKVDKYFLLKVSDDGIGFKSKECNNIGSLGLLGMKERALSIGGLIRIESAPGKGTTITLIVNKFNVPFNQWTPDL
jgi:PAS domain S-box-containing protein